MDYISPQVIYSVAIMDDTLIITPGDTSNMKVDDKLESLAYRFSPDGGLAIVNGKIHVLPTYKPILNQKLTEGLLDCFLDINDIEFAIYKMSPYLVHSASKSLLTEVPDALYEVLDPVHPNKYCTTIMEDKLMLVSLSYLGRPLKAKEMVPEEDVKFLLHKSEDPVEVLEKSHFLKNSKSVYLTDCSLVEQGDYITLITNKVHENLASTIAHLKTTEMVDK